MCIWISSTTFVWRNKRDMIKKMYIGLCVNYPIWMKLEFSRQIFDKASNIKFLENPFSGSRVVPCERTDRWPDRRIDMTKLIVAFRNLANAPNNWLYRRTRILGFAWRANIWTAAITAFWSISVGGWWTKLTFSLQWTTTCSWFVGIVTAVLLHVTFLNEKVAVNICMLTCKQVWECENVLRFLRCSQRRCPGFKSSGMWRYVSGWVLLCRLLTLENEGSRSIETSGTTHPTTLFFIPEHLRPENVVFSVH
jgi:hypothetical protein